MAPRYRVVAISILGGQYDAEGWLEIRTREPDLRWWEARCKVVGWDHHELTGSMPVDVQLGLVGGGDLSGRAYVYGARNVWGRTKADLKVHGTESGFTISGGDQESPRAARLRRLVEMPGVVASVLLTVLIAVATLAAVLLFLTLSFAPQVIIDALGPRLSASLVGAGLLLSGVLVAIRVWTWGWPSGTTTGVRRWAVVLMVGLIVAGAWLLASVAAGF